MLKIIWGVKSWKQTLELMWACAKYGTETFLLKQLWAKEKEERLTLKKYHCHAVIAELILRDDLILFSRQSKHSIK